MRTDLSYYRPSTWTAFPALPLIGSGTSQVESFASYVVRLQGAAGVSRSSFFQLIDGQEFRQGGNHRSSLVGPGGVCRRRALRVGELTGQELIGSTLAPFSDIVQARGSGLRSEHERRWCPMCLREERGAGLIERLVWCFSEYSYCTLHDTPILNACLSCGSKVRLGSGVVYLHCELCGESLDSRLADEATSPLQRWLSFAIEGMIAWSSSNGSGKVDPTNYQRFVQGLIDDGTLDRIRKVHPIFWKDTTQFRRRRPTFATLINFAAVKSIDPISILTDPVPAASSSLFPSEDVEGLIACDLGDYSVVCKRSEILVKALLKSGTRCLPSDKFLSELVSKGPNCSALRICPSYARMSALRADRERQLMGAVMGAKCIRIATVALKEGATKAKAATAVRTRTMLPGLLARHAALTASVLLRALSSDSFKSVN